MSAYDGINLPKPTRDIEQGRRDLDEFGYCIHLDVIDSGQVAALRSRLDEQARLEREQGVAWMGDGAWLGKDAAKGGTWVGGPRHGIEAPWQGVRAALNKGREFVELMMNPLILEYKRHIFRNSAFYLSSMTGLIVRAGARAMATHIDQAYIPFDTPYPAVSNVMVALSAFRDDMGATRVRPGSHRMPAPKLTDAKRTSAYELTVDGMVAVECPPGAAIFFEGRTWHSSGASTSSDVRYSVSAYYALAFVRPQDVFVASLHDDVYAAMSEEQRAMCGFKLQHIGNLYPRFPGDRTNVNAKHPYVPELRADSTKKAQPLV